MCDQKSTYITNMRTIFEIKKLKLKTKTVFFQKANSK